MSESIEVGTIVRLKSGGPEMTTKHRDIDSSGNWECQWFDNVGTLRNGWFPEGALAIIKKG